MSVYLVFPFEGEPTPLYSMGDTRIEAVRKYSFVKDVRNSKKGGFGGVIAQRIRGLALENCRIGTTQCDSRLHEFMPVNHYPTLTRLLPNAKFDLVGS
jgi:hypothetical protein